MIWPILLAGAIFPGPNPAPEARRAEPVMPRTGLAPARLAPNLCLVRYRISTDSPECQAFFDQGLGWYYSYVWIEAARSFETALRHDPDCPMAWWGLSRALERWQPKKAAWWLPTALRSNAGDAAKRAYDLRSRASDREAMLLTARVQERGLLPGVGDQEKRTRAAIATIDTMLTLYDDDEEAWYYRAQLSGGSGMFGGQVSAVPFYKALLRVNPLHPGANHELVHFYETSKRPALGWPYAENYIKSSPGIAHPFHMQAHLATRIGRWDKTADRSAHAIELQRAYHKQQVIDIKDDWQYDHHLDILTRSLIHDGRFREARAAKEESLRAGYRHWPLWVRLHAGERDWAEAEKAIEKVRREDKTQASYLAAVLYLRQGDPARAAPEVEVLRQACQEKKGDKTLELRLWEAQGLLMCLTGAGEAGLKLLARAVERTKDDYAHHAWGGGASFMEQWGTGALACGRLDVAEEAFQEALAHDPGSVRGALGMQVVCERQGRAEEARRFAELARRAWTKAESLHFEAEQHSLRELGGQAPAVSSRPSVVNPQLSVISQQPAVSPPAR